MTASSWSLISFPHRQSPMLAFSSSKEISSAAPLLGPPVPSRRTLQTAQRSCLGCPQYLRQLQHPEPQPRSHAAALWTSCTFLDTLSSLWMPHLHRTTHPAWSHFFPQVLCAWLTPAHPPGLNLNGTDSEKSSLIHPPRPHRLQERPVILPSFLLTPHPHPAGCAQGPCRSGRSPGQPKDFTWCQHRITSLTGLLGRDTKSRPSLPAGFLPTSPWNANSLKPRTVMSSSLVPWGACHRSCTEQVFQTCSWRN